MSEEREMARIVGMYEAGDHMARLEELCKLYRDALHQIVGMANSTNKMVNRLALIDHAAREALKESP